MRQALSRLPKAELVRALHDEHNINGADLGSVDLSGVNLARCNLSGGRFNDADLTGSHLQGSIARSASFLRARMQGVAMPGAALEGAGFRSADLRAANLSWADLRSASFAAAEMSDAQLFSATMTDAVLTDAVLERSRLDSVDLDDAILQSANMAGAILHGTTLRSADLSGADLRRADLRGVDMTDANLLEAQLGGAVYDADTVFPAGFTVDGVGMYFLGPRAHLARIDLRGFEFRGQDLTQADLFHANLVDSDLRGATLAGANMAGARLRRALYDDSAVFPVGYDVATTGAYAVVPGATIVGAKMQWKHLREVALSGASLHGADLTGADLSRAELNSADLSRAILQTANMAEASLHGADLQEAMLKGAVLRGADMRRANVRGADLSWADLAEADLRGADMMGARLVETLLRGARYNDGTAFPSAFDPSVARMVGGDGGRTRGGVVRRRVAVEPYAVRAVAAARRDLQRRWQAARLRLRLSAERAARAITTSLAARAAMSPLVCFSVSAAIALAAAAWSGDLRWPSGSAVTLTLSASEPAEAPAPAMTYVAGAAPIAIHRSPAVAAAMATVVVAPTAARSPAGSLARADVPAVRAPVAVARAGEASEPVAPSMIRGAAAITMPSLASYGRPALHQVETAVAVSAPQGDAAEPAGSAVDDHAAAPIAAAPAANAAEVLSARVSPPTSAATQVALASRADANEAADSEITAAVEEWRHAWEQRDLDAYVGLCQVNAPAPRQVAREAGRGAPQFSKARLQARATDLFSQYGRIRMDVGRMDVRREGDVVVSSFDQDFTAWRVGSDSTPAFVGHGRKTLVFARDDRSEWRIVSEEWRQRTQ